MYTARLSVGRKATNILPLYAIVTGPRRSTRVFSGLRLLPQLDGRVRLDKRLIAWRRVIDVSARLLRSYAYRRHGQLGAVISTIRRVSPFVGGLQAAEVFDYRLAYSPSGAQAAYVATPALRRPFTLSRRLSGHIPLIRQNAMIFHNIESWILSL